MPENHEAKFACDDLAAADRGVVALGATFAGELRQVDTYFPVPRGRLKLREQLAPTENAELIRYDRADEAAIRTSRYDRLPVADPERLATILTSALGEAYAIVRKVRRVYLFERARIHLDQVDELGTFAEIEVVRPEEPIEPNKSPEERDRRWSDVADSLARRIVTALGVRFEHLQRGSYADLLESNRRSSYKG